MIPRMLQFVTTTTTQEEEEAVRATTTRALTTTATATATAALQRFQHHHPQLPRRSRRRRQRHGRKIRPIAVVGKYGQSPLPPSNSPFILLLLYYNTNIFSFLFVYFFLSH